MPRGACLNHAERRKHGAMGRQQYLRDAQRFCKGADVQTAGTAKATQRERPRIFTALDRYDTQRLDHVLVGQAHDAERGIH